MASADPRIKPLKIKTSVVKRLDKEHKSYQEESVLFEAKVDKMKVDKKDSYDIKKQEEVLQESKMMIPDCQRRLKVAFAELDNMMETEKDLAETEEYKAAKKQLEETRPKIETDKSQIKGAQV